MQKLFLRYGLCVLCILALIFSSLAPTLIAAERSEVEGSDAAVWLEAADLFLSPSESKSKVEIRIFKAERLHKKKNYTVYTQDPRKTLVLFNTPKEKGQKVLMKAHNFWVFLPKSKRPLRITAQQKLFGDAATGDITAIRWSVDYKGVLTSCDEQTCSFTLEKKHKGPTYERVVLALRRSDAQPVSADLYLNPKKIAKSAQYFFESGKSARLTKVIYDNKIKKKQTTEVLFKSITQYKAPSRWFNPSFLVGKTTIE